MLLLALLLALTGAILVAVAVVVARELERLLHESRTDPHFNFFRLGTAEIVLFFSGLGGVVCLCIGGYALLVLARMT